MSTTLILLSHSASEEVTNILVTEQTAAGMYVCNILSHIVLTVHSVATIITFILLSPSERIQLSETNN